MPGKIAEPNVNIWYMDRSGISIRFDTGVHGPRDNHRETIPIGSLSTVLQAEMMVILRCTQLLLSKNVTRNRIHICFDSRAAVAALAKTTTELALLWQNMQVLEKLCGSNKVTLVRVPGHHRIQGNEEADKLAKEGTNGISSDKLLASPFLWVKSHQESFETRAPEQLEHLL
jgi:ribonuclease HI